MTDSDTSAASGPPLDLGPQSALVADLAAGVDDARLDAPTPCEDMPVGSLLGHIAGLATAFRDAARKDVGPTTNTAPPAVPSVPDGWRAELPKVLDELALAWREEAAWQGETQAGGVALPGALAGRIALNELLLHGWDLAVATGRPYAPDEDSVRASYDLLAPESDSPSRAGRFGPVVAVPDDAPLLDRVVGLSGRDPHWRV